MLHSLESLVGKLFAMSLRIQEVIKTFFRLPFDKLPS